MPEYSLLSAMRLHTSFVPGIGSPLALLRVGETYSNGDRLPKTVWPYKDKYGQPHTL